MQCSINFSVDSALLCVSSDKGTVHVFHLAAGDARRRKKSLTKDLLPKYFSSVWSFAKFSVTPGVPSICAFGADPGTVVALCLNGIHYRASFNEKVREALSFSTIA